MALQITPKTPEQNNREYAYSLLRKNIMNFWLEPGESLNENDLSTLFGMSRTPVHEAIIKLRDEHLVDVFPQHGSNVSYIDIALVREGYFMRIHVEPPIIEDLAGKIAPADANDLLQILELQKQSLQTDYPIHNYMGLDDQFHQHIYRLCGMPHLWDSIKSLSSHFDRVRYLDAMVYDKDYLSHFIDEHHQLVEILLVGLPSGFSIDDFLTTHISSYKKSFMHLSKTYPHYFLRTH